MTHAWMPVSPCGEACLTRGEPTVGRVRVALRLAALLAVLLSAMALGPLALLLPPGHRTRALRWFFRCVLSACGVRLVVHGDLDGHGRGALVVNNHVSWLDIVGINAVRPMRALAKREVGEWPVLGRLVARAGSVFVDRERLRSLPSAVAGVAEALRGGALLNVCPEGTTWCGRASGRFRPALFQAALDAGVPVRPLALRYRLAGGRETTRPAFVGPESLVRSVARTVRLRGLVLEMFVCPEIAPGRARDRRVLAALATDAVGAALGTVSVRRPPTPQPAADAGAAFAAR